MFKRAVYTSILFILYIAWRRLRIIKIFNRKCILITGGAGELGIKLLELFLKNKEVTIIIVDIDQNKLNTLADTYKGNIITYCCDITDKPAVHAMIKSLQKKFTIDTLINNAGVVSKKELSQLRDEDIDKTFKVNVIAPIILTREILPQMIKNGAGHIVNISSVAGLVGAPKLTDYCASKFALVGFHAALQKELEVYPNIYSSCICPYFFRSELFNSSKGYPWPLNYFIRIYTSREIAAKIYNDIDSLVDMSIHPPLFKYLLRIRFMFPKYIQDKFINLGSRI
tara:strand:+ start:2741 stop:3589 length:849 start_codon:yes stop_codon:yes gene_type:complete